MSGSGDLDDGSIILRVTGSAGEVKDDRWRSGGKEENMQERKRRKRKKKEGWGNKGRVWRRSLTVRSEALLNSEIDFNFYTLSSLESSSLCFFFT